MKKLSLSSSSLRKGLNLTLYVLIGICIGILLSLKFFSIIVIKQVPKEPEPIDLCKKGNSDSCAETYYKNKQGFNEDATLADIANYYYQKQTGKTL